MMRCIVVGANGHMGKQLISAIYNTDGIKLVAAIVKNNASNLDEDVGSLIGAGEVGIKLTSCLEDKLSKADVVIDFTLPLVGMKFIELAANYGVNYILGTTGFSEDQEKKIKQFGQKIAIVKSANMSVGINLLAKLVYLAAQKLDSSFDTEIIDIHHKLKVDAPSGTALLLAQNIAKARSVNLNDKMVTNRNGKRKLGDIGIASLRGGNIIGDHKVIFAGNNETIEISHRANDRLVFAKGAVQAALWIQNKNPGIYSMEDVINL